MKLIAILAVVILLTGCIKKKQTDEEILEANEKSRQKIEQLLEISDSTDIKLDSASRQKDSLDKKAN